jgi:hypothetical protein
MLRAGVDSIRLTQAPSASHKAKTGSSPQAVSEAPLGLFAQARQPRWCGRQPQQRSRQPAVAAGGHECIHPGCARVEWEPDLLQRALISPRRGSAPINLRKMLG